MSSGRQGELFPTTGSGLVAAPPQIAPPLLARQLLEWQQRLADHQAPLFAGDAPAQQQQLLLLNEPGAADALINPLTLQAQPLSFWRWPQPLVQGPALYFVLDRPRSLPHPLLLYVGETARAESRWKGEHDCKGYLAAYGEALQQAGLGSVLSICFSSDVPSQTKPRRALEQSQIRRWLPPFNKETRSRWATPFQADDA
ncbi:MAG: GIY-YIG nuclease family protein [Cyanobacteriota bacterium]|nr:GIY-YIG nuclease family protein [Cyanobacteriota bacterium]